MIQVCLQQRSLKDNQRTSRRLSVNFNRTYNNSWYEFDDTRAKISHSSRRAEDANSESSTENMDVESYRGIESPSSCDFSNEHASKVDLFWKRDETKS